jgi:hypothetical protein
MNIIKSEIVGHFGAKDSRISIYSIDCQPFGSRLATGGGGTLVFW